MDVLLQVYIARYVILQDAVIEASTAPDREVRGILVEALYRSMLGPGDLGLVESC